MDKKRPMEIDETPEERAFRQRVRTWFATNLPPGWGRPDFPQPETEQQRAEFLKAWQRKLYEGGWAGLSWPKEYGGQGASLVEQAIFLEERDRVKPPHDLGLSGIAGIGPMIIDWGTEEQKQRYLPKMLAAEELWCQGFSEPEAGSDLASLRTRATLVDAHFVIDGQKIWTSRAVWCQQMLMLARTDTDLPKHRGLSALIVPMDAPGLTVRAIKQINGVDTEFAEVFLDGVIVPRENLVGALNDGWNVALRNLMHERITASRCYETAQMLEDLVAGCRAVNGHGGGPLDDAGIQLEVGRLYAEVLGARLSYRAMLEEYEERGTLSGEENIGKLHCNLLAQRIAILGSELLELEVPRHPARQLIGGPTDWSFDLMNTQRYSIGGGTSQIQRNVIGERVLGLPR